MRYWKITIYWIKGNIKRLKWGDLMFMAFFVGLSGYYPVVENGDDNKMKLFNSYEEARDYMCKHVNEDEFRIIEIKWTEK